MRFLADENVPGELVAALKGLGHDVSWVRVDAAGSDDASVLERARRESRVLVTLDKDFGELAFRGGLPLPCGIVLIRVPAPSPGKLVETVLRAFAQPREWAGSFTVIEEDRVRFRPLPGLPPA